MSSRFFASGDSSESEDEVQESQKVTAEPAQASARYALESSDEEDDQQRVVRSEKDKRFDSLKSIIKSLQNAIKISDWVNILNQFEKLQVELGKAKKVVRKEGIPKFYFKAVVDLDTFFKDTSKNKEALKKLNKANQKAFAAMKQKLLKHNKEFEKEIATYLQNPLGSDEEEEEEKEKPTTSKKTTDKKEEDSDSDDDDDFKKDDSDSESSDSDIDLNQKSMFERKFWEKKPSDIAREKRRAEQKALMDSQKKEIDKEKGKQRELNRQARAAEKQKEKQQIAQGAKKEVELTPEMISKKLKEILASRGRKGTDRKQVIDDLRLLASKARAPLTLLKVQITLCSALFETSLNRGTHMQVDYWKAALTELNAIITSLNENPQIRLSEDEEVEEKDDDDDEDAIEKAIGSLIITDEKKEQKKQKEEETKAEDGNKVEYVIGNLYSFIHRICAEYTNSLRHIDHHTPEYLSRLRDERDLILLIARAQDYYTKIKKDQFLARVILRRMELVYYHYNPELDEQGKNSEKKVKPIRWDTVPLQELAEYLYRHGTGRDRTRALLFHIYYLSIHNRFTEARDLILMSHIQDTINEADIKTRILFNRSIAQFGLCAFRVGEYRHALNSLADFYPSNRIKELLAQGVSRSYADRNLEKEKEERRRQYPFHMHINIDMIEAFHLISAMFEEVPNMAIYSSNRRRIISKTFRHHFNHHSRQAFNGPPENTRDGVMAATAALQEADWEKSFKYIKDLKVWTYVPHLDIVQNLIQNKIQEVALRTYLLSYAPQYVSVDMKTLSTMFKLDEKFIHKVASDMIFTDQLQGAWDQTSSVILMATQPLTRLQRTALAFSEKAALFVEQNERLMDQRNGYYARPSDRDRSDRSGWGNTSQKRPTTSSASRVHW